MSALLYLPTPENLHRLGLIRTGEPRWSQYEWCHPHDGAWLLQPWRGDHGPFTGRVDIRNIVYGLPLFLGVGMDVGLDRLVRCVNAHTRRPEILGRGVLRLQETYDRAAAHHIGATAVQWLGGSILDLGAESPASP